MSKHDTTYTSLFFLAKDAIEEAKALDDIGCISVISDYDEIATVLVELLQYPDVEVGALELHDVGMSGYNKEFALTIDENLIVSIEPIYYTEKELYLGYYSSVVFINNDCNSILFSKNHAEKARYYCYDINE